MDHKKILYVLRAIGLSGIFRAINNSLYRDITENYFQADKPVKTQTNPGTLKEVDSIHNGASFNFELFNVEVIFLTENMARISWGPAIAPYPYTIARHDWKIQKPILDADTNKKEYTLLNGNIHLKVKETGEFTFLDNNHSIIRKDEPPLRINDQWIHSTILNIDEHIYGLGERSAPLNLRPGMYCSWNKDRGGRYITGADPLYIGTPVYLSLSSKANYLVYFENSYRSSYVINEKLTSSFDGGMLRYYIIFGSLETIYSHLAELTGYPFLPPRWVLGYHQSRWGYCSEAEIREIAARFESNRLPISAIHLDIDYMEGYRVFTHDSKRFPDMAGLIQFLDKKGVKIVSSINPAVKQDKKYAVCADGMSNDVFCKFPNGDIVSGVSWPGKSFFPDFSNPKVRDWWADQYQYLFNLGVSGIWHDMNEPSSFTAWGDITLPLVTYHDFDGQEGTHAEFHNLYGLLMNKSCFESFKKYTPHKRPWIFSRSGWTGLQKYAWNWTGDTDSSWDSLKRSISTMLGLGLSGAGFSGTDIGGFSGNPDAELYLRWFQMATFFPLFRTHSAYGTNKREPWSFGEKTTEIIRTFLNLRYKLLPYFYTLFWESTRTGYPPLRPLFWADPSDSKLWDIDDEFLVGESILVAPVVCNNTQTRKVKLPPGSWYSLWNDQLFIGPGDIEEELSLETIPVYIKAGAVLPFQENKYLSFHIYPLSEGSSTNLLYNDAGDGYGPHRIDRFDVKYFPDAITITWKKEGAYPFPHESVELILHSSKEVQAIADNIIIPSKENKVISPLFQQLILEYI